MYDPEDFIDESDLNDYQVRQHLYAQKRLAEAEALDAEARRAKVEKILFEALPGPKVCSMFVTTGAEEGEKAKRSICGRAGVRMLRLTGDWTCAEHDPLAQPYWGQNCCGRTEE